MRQLTGQLLPALGARLKYNMTDEREICIRDNQGREQLISSRGCDFSMLPAERLGSPSNGTRGV